MLTCAMCKATKEGKFYKYNSSFKDVKLDVCADCHKANVAKIQQRTKNLLGPDSETGILRAKE